ncbi:MAG: glycosyltransferase [Candidatus Omnitrophota bacterium]
MYISEVSGHRSATMAIGKAIKALAPETEIMNINAFNYTNPVSEKIINRLYMGVIKSVPQLWSYLYDNPNVVKKLEKIKNNIHKMNSPKLRRLFEKFNPDIVVCTQAFPCGMVAYYKKDYPSPLSLVAVLTDYIPHAFWVYDTVDYYITPSEDVTDRLVKKGIPTGKIRSLGIPFDHKFNEPLEQNKLFQKYRLNPDIPTLLIMGGGQGLGPIKAIVKSLEKVRRPLQEIIVAGMNKKLYNSLKRKIKKSNKKILLFGFVNFINELMDICDVIISKPGGVTTAEVLSKRIPMLIIKPIPGQEVSNSDYLTGKGAALKVDEPKEIGGIIEGLLNNPEKMNRMREAAGKISKPNASLDIAKLILNL